MITIWGKPACPSCLKAKAMCEKYQFKFEYKELGKDFTREEVFETFPTAKTFPQIIVRGNKVGGYEQFVKYVEDTNYTGTGHSL
jgi:glutaredoxin 3|tara:strand:+ start:684 stop:935 length:252 start_codon:yes stop_codon:yes gene_type:complete